MSQVKVCPRCGIEYSADTKFCPEDGSTLRPRGSSEALVGQVIADRYFVKSELGVGGMGRVYLAEHVKMGRRCALKVLRPELLGDPDSILRFNREASNASRIAHTNVVTVYDFGETQDGLVYLAMEFVEGEALSAILRREKFLPPRRATSIACQVAEGLTAAHDARIIHRDLKPENIMVARNRDGSDLAKVVDFGIARVFEDPGQRVTMTGLVAGTLAYMSPEQLRGEKLDERTDIFALGVTYYLTLTGEYPFPDRSRMDAMDSRRSGARPLADVRPDVAWPASLQAAVDRAMAHARDDRFSTAREFAQAIATAVLEWQPDEANASEPWNARLGVYTPASNRVIEQSRVAPHEQPSTAPPPPATAAPPTATPEASPGFVLETIAGTSPAGALALPLATEPAGTVVAREATVVPEPTRDPAAPSAPSAAAVTVRPLSPETRPPAPVAGTVPSTETPNVPNESSVAQSRVESAPRFRDGPALPPPQPSNRARNASFIVIAAGVLVIGVTLLRPGKQPAPAPRSADSTGSVPGKASIGQASAESTNTAPVANPSSPDSKTARPGVTLPADVIRLKLDSLKELTPPTGTPAMATAALRIAHEIAPSLTTHEERVEARYWEANADLLLDRHDDACRALNSVAAESRGTKFEVAIGAMRGLATKGGLGCR